jgi:uncharacterized protein
MLLVALKVIGSFAAVIGCSVALAQPSSYNTARPSFDCTKAASPLALTICSSQTAADADWELISAYWAYRFSLGEERQAKLDKDQSTWFRSLNQICALADTPNPPFPRATSQHISSHR